MHVHAPLCNSPVFRTRSLHPWIKGCRTHQSAPAPQISFSCDHCRLLLLFGARGQLKRLKFLKLAPVTTLRYSSEPSFTHRLGGSGITEKEARSLLGHVVDLIPLDLGWAGLGGSAQERHPIRSRPDVDVTTGASLFTAILSNYHFILLFNTTSLSPRISQSYLSRQDSFYP